MIPLNSTRRRGKIAHLPYAIRADVCGRLRDGQTYRAISEWLESCGHPGITEKNVEAWAKPDPETQSCGYQDWLAEQAKLETLRANRDFALEVVRQGAGGDIHEAGLSFAASSLFDALTGFDIDKLKASLADKPELFLEVVNSLAKMSKPGLDFAKYREAVAEKKAAISARMTEAKGRGGITDETFDLIERELKLL